MSDPGMTNSINPLDQAVLVAARPSYREADQAFVTPADVLAALTDGQRDHIAHAIAQRLCFHQHRDWRYDPGDPKDVIAYLDPAYSIVAMFTEEGRR